MSLHDITYELLSKIMASNATHETKLYEAVRLLAKYRSTLIANTIAQQDTARVQSGPFAGMVFVRQVNEGCVAPKLLGCYENGLHPYIESAIAKGYDAVINIGCAEGYYAIGLARRMPDTTVYAYDINAGSCDTCRLLANENGVSERMIVGGEFRGEDFAEFAGRRTLLVCDIEGAEESLLDPDNYPALKEFDLIVELHDSIKPGISERVPARFQTSHEIHNVNSTWSTPELPDYLNKLGELDQLMAVWEWRTGPTPWAVMYALHES